MAQDSESNGLFRRLTQLFRSGPVVKRRVKNFETTPTSSAFELFQKTQSHVYSSAMSAYGTYDRMARYSDFSEMEYTPEISSALDIYAEESVSADEKGSALHVFSENNKIQSLLDELFFDTLNIEFNMTSWVRNLCKYGDFFLFNDVHPEYGVINAYPMPVSEVEREEGFDPEDPLAVRFRWVTQGNNVLENWQVSHFRLLGNDAFIPYGSSVLEAARRIWRQMILVEDAMLVYRIVRSPERRVFYVDVGNVPPEEIPNYMEQVQKTLKKAQVVDKETGRVDLRYNPLSVDEDYFLPVRGSESGTKIDTLAGGQNATAIEDVEYIQKKLFAALKVPKAYLGYDEGLGAKATLSQEDIRFSRTIARIQRTVISELNKLAIVHLFCHGFEGEDLLDFDLKLSNPSTIAQQQKLELFRTRFEIAGQAPEGLVDRAWIRKNVMGMSDNEIERILDGRLDDRRSDLEVEAARITADTSADAEAAAEDDTAGAIDLAMGGPPEDLEASDVSATSSPLIVDSDSSSGFFDIGKLSINDEDAPIKAQNKVDRFIGMMSEEIEEEENEKDDDSEKKGKKKKRRRNNAMMASSDGNITTKGLHPKRGDGEDSIRNPYGSLRDLTGGNLTEDEIMRNWEDEIDKSGKMTNQIKSALKSLESQISISRRKVLSEQEDIPKSENRG
tara:strand:+ start:38563 stop:40581 length:2019 start_codon:yes stop_codon:yes gene_type:complete